MIGHCPHCRRAVENPGLECPHCRKPMALRKERELEIGQTVRDMNKFVIIAIVFFLLLIPLGMCIQAS